MTTNKTYNENCLDTMARMPDGFIDLTVTSPPYDNLRSYKDNIHETWGEHVWKPIIRELHRVTKKGGVVVWVVGDATIKGSETGTSFKQALFAMDCGFKLHDTMIYRKNNFSVPFPDKYHQVFEYMFVLSKGKKKTFNPLIDRKNKKAGKSGGIDSITEKDGTRSKRSAKIISDYGKRHNVWDYHTGLGHTTKEKFAFKHPAIFPEQLANDHILSWSNEGDLIYDPFGGSGTTAKMAILNKRDFILSELSKEYCEDIIEPRLKKARLQMNQTQLF